MSDIPTTLSKLTAELATLQTALAGATAQGGQAGSVAAAIRKASAAVTYLSTRTDTESKQIQADGAAADAAAAALKAALAAVKTAQTAGSPPPLADATATALKSALVTANGVSATDFDTKGVAAVTTLDGDIATIGDAERTALDTAQTTLAAKQAALVKARADAQTAMARLQAEAGSVTARLAAASANLTQANALRAAADTASHRAAIVAFADYSAGKTSLAAELTADPNGTVALGKWTAARDALLSALADAADAEEATIEKQLALDTKLAEKAAKLATRNADALAAVLTALP